jgi:hypothetical protein
LLCLVFFTQTAFADWDFWCDDCQDERIACRRELRTCYQNNGNCQNLHKNESAQIKKLAAQRNTCIREKKRSVQAVGFGALVLVVLGGGCYINGQWKKIAQKDAQIQGLQKTLIDIANLVQN